MTAPSSSAMPATNSGVSLSENLANAHISNGRTSTETDKNDTQTSLTTSGHATTDVAVSEDGENHQDPGNDKKKDPFLLEKKGNCFILPQCPLPPKEKFAGMEQFVEKAVSAKMDTTVDDKTGMALYKAVVVSIKGKGDPSMLYMLLLALRTAGNGSTFHMLSSNPTKHVQLMHFLMRLNPFDRIKGKDSTPSSTNNNTSNIIATVGKDSEAYQSSEQTNNEEFIVHEYSIPDAYFHLILALVSANSVFLVPVLTSLWRLLATQSVEIPAARTQRLHATLAAITRLCPKGKTEIFPVISTNFPFRTQPENELIWCYRQCLEIVEYVPDINNQVFHFIIDKCLEMDVEIKIHDGGEVTLDDEPEKDDCMFDLELNDAPPRPKVPAENITVDEMADKLDSLMLLVLKFLERKGKNGVTEARTLFGRCRPAFESSILITHRSKFVQFILFYLCGLESAALAAAARDEATRSQQHATLYREFAANLIEIIFDPYRATVVRQSAACYLASFLSRGNFVEADTICESLAALLSWADAYIANLQAKSLSAADARDQCDLHSLFYTICQASFYITCFRGGEAVRFFRFFEELKTGGIDPVPEHLREVELSAVDISPARWVHICSHGLQPLKYCLETVRDEFLTVASAFHLLDSELLDRLCADHDQQSSSIRRKKASQIQTPATLEIARRDGGVGGLGRGSNPLDSFFPFDPYLLRRSHPYIDPFYRNWGDDNQGDAESIQMVQDDDDDDDDDDESMPADAESNDESSSSDEEDERLAGSLDDKSMVSATPPQIPDALLTAQLMWQEAVRRDRAESIESETGSW